MPTEDIRRYRGDWLLRALTDDHHGMTPWQRLDGTPPGIPKPAPGRYDPTTQKWDTQAGPKRSANALLITIVAIPPEPRIHHPGERIWLTPTDFDQIHDHLTQARLDWAFARYAQHPTYSVATYQPNENRVRWGRSIPPHLRAPLAKIVHALNDLIPYQPTQRDSDPQPAGSSP